MKHMITDAPRPLPAALAEIVCGHCKTPLDVNTDRDHVCTRCLLNYGTDPYDEQPPRLHGVQPCGWTPGLPVRSGTIVVQHPCALGAGHFGDHRYAEEHVERKGTAWTAGVSDA